MVPGKPARRARRVRTASVVLALLVLGGCRPDPPGPEVITCLPHDPAAAVDYQQAFDTRGVWAGGDIGASVDLGDGRVLWLFGDTFVDGLGPLGQPGAMVRNSVVVQQGRCFSLVNAGTPGHRRDALPAVAPGEWLWPSGGVVDVLPAPTAARAAGTVRITALRMAAAPGPPGWNWRVTGVAVVSLRTEDLAVVAATPAPITQDGAVQWGGGTFAAGPWVYVYGWRRDHQVVARTTVAGMATEPWEVLGAGGWTTDRERAVQPVIAPAPAAQFWVVPYAGGYLASAKRAEMDSHDVSTWWGPTPVGPFRLVGQAGTTEGTGSPWITYAGLVTVWSRNYRWPTPAMDARRYGPRFAPPAPAALP
jgi:hypothetical protein